MHKVAYIILEYTQCDEAGTPWNFDIVSYTQTYRHANVSENFTIIPKCLSHPRHSACRSLLLTLKTFVATTASCFAPPVISTTEEGD